MRTAFIDEQAIEHNIRTLMKATPGAAAMAVVKADGYGHGAARVARSALAGGATWLGVCDVHEALALRSAGITAPLLCWLHAPDVNFREAVHERVDIGVSHIGELAAVARAAKREGVTASVHVKIDTGLSRNGASKATWSSLFEAAKEHETTSLLRVRGIFSHLANAGPDDDDAALHQFRVAWGMAREAGLRPSLRHLAASAAGLSRPAARMNLVRWGIATYGLSPFAGTSSSELGLRPAMTLMSRVVHLRDAPAGTGVSYDYAYRTSADTTLALVPMGYADGVPRAASGSAVVGINGRRWPVRGRIAMDQFVVEVERGAVDIGDAVTIFGDPADCDVPSADEWAEAAGTINYEIVARIGSRVARQTRD